MTTTAQKFLLSLWFTVLVGTVGSASAQGKEAAFIIPVRAPAFVPIEEGIREAIGSELTLRVLLASDFAGQPEGVVEAALADRPFVLLPLGTTLCRSFLAAGETRELPPIICVAVTNPLDVLPDSELESGRVVRATVVPDGPTSIYPGTADLIHELYPSAERLGTVYNPGEANSLTNRERIAMEAERHGWQLIEKSINGPEDVEPIAQALLAERPDAIWISKDRIMTSQPQALIELAHRQGVPVFASDAGTVEYFEALGTRSVSFKDLGLFVGGLALEVHEGRDVRLIPISTVEETEVFLSRPAMAELGLKFPEELLTEAVLIGSTQETLEGTQDLANSANDNDAGLVWIIAVVGLGVLILLWLVVVRARMRG